MIVKLLLSLCVIVHKTKLPVILQVTADKAIIEEVLGHLPTRKIAPWMMALGKLPPGDDPRIIAPWIIDLERNIKKLHSI